MSRVVLREAAVDRPSVNIAIPRHKRRFPSSQMHLVQLVFVSTAFAASVIAADAAPAPPYPESPRKPVTDTYQGTRGAVAVSDDYRWLENLSDPAVKDWVAAQNATTRRFIDALPQRAAIKKELQELIGHAPVSRFSFEYAGGKLFALKRQPPKNQPMLVTLAAPDRLGSERVVLDPNRRNAKGTTAIDWYVPSLDGRRVAVSLSDNGSEAGTMHILDTATGRELSDIVPRVHNPTAGGSAAWNADGSGIWYTRYPQGSERPQEDAGFYQQVWFHKLGTPSSSDRYVLGEELPRIAEIRLESSEDGRYTLADVSNGDGGEHGFWLRGPDDAWKKLADFSDGFRSAAIGRDGRLYALALKDAPRGKVVAMKLEAASLADASEVVPQSDAVIEVIVPSASRLYLEVLRGGPSELRAYTLEGQRVEAPEVAPISNVVVGARLAGDAILYGSQGFVAPFAWYRADPARDGGRPEKTLLSPPPKHQFDNAEVTRVMAKSKDGTEVPVNIVARKGIALDGTHPVVLTSYGGYGVSERPYFARRNVFWLRHGGVFAQANIRGGGEFGEEWHRAGNLVNKQNVFDDFAAAAQMLIERGYTSANKLAIEGGSNGGLLMGAELVQHPERFAAVVSHVGIYDMLRVELSPNGAFNVTEFGSVENPAQFNALHAYSPLHHAENGTADPAVLLTTGINDGRVEPWQSFKMAARLQAATASGKPVLLRVAGDAGHGQGMSLSSAIELDADVFAFLFESLGMSTGTSPRR